MEQNILHRPPTHIGVTFELGSLKSVIYYALSADYVYVIFVLLAGGRIRKKL